MTRWHAFAPLAAILLVAVMLMGCASPPEPDPNLLAPTDEQTKLRTLQTRSFEVSTRDLAVRGVIVALQDLGFIIERANADMGLVTAARFAEPRYSDVIAITVTVRPQDDGRMSIRANAIFNNKPVTESQVYQNFFASLERSMFIGRN